MSTAPPPGPPGPAGPPGPPGPPPPGYGPPPPGYGPAPPGYGPAAPRKRRTGLIIAIVCAAVLGAVIVGALALAFVGMSLSSAKVGDCLEANEAGTKTERRDCADAAANYVILGITESSRACVDVVGATATFEVSDTKVFCVGEKGADPAKAVNGTQVGDCMVVKGDAAERTACGAGTRKVLEILRNQLRATGGGADLSTKCMGVEGAEVAYAWSLESTKRSLVGTYDLIFCLGPDQ